VRRVEIESGSPDVTAEIGGHLARELVSGDVVTVSGELGTGKTTFVRGACRALGVTAPVTSPTYTIGHRYEGDPDVSHLDLYRFTSVSPAEWADLEPYFEGAIVFVEWPEAAGAGLPGVRARVRLEHVDETHRRIRLDTCDPIGDTALVERIARADPGLRHGDRPRDERDRR
jgi:tRNA threonylcarbamoyladenosine biosynthesis protein TsaE